MTGRGPFSKSIGLLSKTSVVFRVAIASRGEHLPQSAKAIVGADLEVVMPLMGLVDIDAERERIRKELTKSDKEIAFVSKKLANEKFLARAPDEVVEKERHRLEEESRRQTLLKDALDALG